MATVPRATPKAGTDPAEVELLSPAALVAPTVVTPRTTDSLSTIHTKPVSIPLSSLLSSSFSNLVYY